MTTLRSGSPLAALLLLFMFDPGLSELKNFAPTIIMCGLVIWGVVKIAPTWKEVKMRELDIREKEIGQREQQAVATQTLAETTREIAIETKHGIEALKIAERVNLREGEKLNDAVHEIMDTVREIVVRVEAIESTKTAEARA
jgi:hypothetical protein